MRVPAPRSLGPTVALAFLFAVAAGLSGGQTTSPGQQTPSGPESAAKPDDDSHRKSAEDIRKETAEEQLKEEEHQRVLGIVPQFNTTSNHDAEPLTVRQKFDLAFKSAFDPVTFAIAALDGGYGQVTDNYPAYGQGVKGFFKYFGASYADTFDGTIIGNAALPALFHEDPRYFRLATGSFKGRLWYAVLSTFRARSDSGKWVPNYGNVLGNLAAGGIANLYYPQNERGVGLTFERAFTVTAEGALGGIFEEFWPDVSHKLFHKKH